MDSASSGGSVSSVTRFTHRAVDISAARASCLKAAVDAILGIACTGGEAVAAGEAVGSASPVAIADLVIVDVGAGTDVSSTLFAAWGVRELIAVGPNAVMRDQIPAPFANLRVREGTAEATGRTDDLAAHLVVCAQTYRGFDPPCVRAELGRILRKPADGHLVVMWHGHGDASPLSSAYVRSVREAAGLTGNDKDAILSHRKAASARVLEAPFVTPPHVLTFANEQRLTRNGLMQRARSSS